MKRIGVYGWGIVAPKSPDIEAFAENLQHAESWLGPFDGFGPSNFLVGTPSFDFADYKDWIDARFPPTRFPQLSSKMDPFALFAVGAFIQSLGQNPGIEEVLQELGTEAHVYVGTGLGAFAPVHDASLRLDRAQRRWARFWASSEHCEALRLHQSGERRDDAAPPDPADFDDPEEREDAERTWNAFWMARSDDLRGYLEELSEVEDISVGGDVETGKMSLLRERERRRSRLQERWQTPDPPWTQVSANVLWNIPNTPAAQISMVGRITGLSFAPVGACATFGVCGKLAMDAIQRGEAKAVVMGAADPPPHALTVGAFHSARVLAAGGGVSKPLTGLRGTHVSGGSVIWIVGERSFMESKGFEPLGMEPVAVGVSEDADHIITPSIEGPLVAIRQALELGGIRPEEVVTWDLHATATPGDYREVENVRRVFPERILITARKGTFGHGMSAGGGWELTAQYLGAERGIVLPTPLAEGELNAEIATLHETFVQDVACTLPPGYAGKLSMGVGGVNACVLSRPLEQPVRSAASSPPTGGAEAEES